MMMGVIVVRAQDPSPDWLAYAKATIPTNGTVSHISAKWVVPQFPKQDSGNFQVWFGIEASDNLNAIQPVLSWQKTHWEIYAEYFQVEPEKDVLTETHAVKPGDVLSGSIDITSKRDAYFVKFENLSGDKWSVNTTIPIQVVNGVLKSYTIAYFVLEQRWECQYYSTSNVVTFYDIVVEYDTVPVIPEWTTSFVQDVCDCRAHILNSKSVQITWNSNK